MPATRHAHEDYPIRRMMDTPIILGHSHQPIRDALRVKIPHHMGALIDMNPKPKVNNHLTKFDLMSGA